jgi:hypothetical protein
MLLYNASDEGFQCGCIGKEKIVGSHKRFNEFNGKERTHKTLKHGEQTGNSNPNARPKLFSGDRLKLPIFENK